MTSLRSGLFPALLLLVSVLLVSCGPKEGDGQDHGKEEAHGHGEESPSGASFEEGRGVIVTDETKAILEIEVTDVIERRIPNRISLTIQIIGVNHHPQLGAKDQGWEVKGSGFVTTNTAAFLKVGQPVEVLMSTNLPLGGIVLAVQKALAFGESEIIIGVSNATAAITPGEFVPARIDLPREKDVTVVPQSAVLRTSEGTFVYTVNDDAYLRTAVKTGSEVDGWVEIADGLYAGDQVVTQPVETLWLIELRATQGGGHSH